MQAIKHKHLLGEISYGALHLISEEVKFTDSVELVNSSHFAKQN